MYRPENLPSDAFYTIFPHLDNRTLSRWRLTNRNFSRLATQYLQPTYQDLLNAIEQERADAVRFLLSIGVDPGGDNTDPTLALALAIDIGNPEIVRLLLQDSRVDLSDGVDILTAGLVSGVPEILEMLLDRVPVNGGDIRNLLHDAVFQGDTEMVRTLLQHPFADVSGENGSALIQTARGYSLDEIEDLLIAAGAPVVIDRSADIGDISDGSDTDDYNPFDMF